MTVPDAHEPPGHPARSQEGLRIALLVTLFAGLAGTGTAWAIIHADVGIDELGDIWQLGIAHLGLIALLCSTLYLADVWRYQVLSHLLGIRLTWRSGLDASVANFFFSWVTPGAAFGAPATVFMLTRRGVPTDAALLIAFGKSITGTLVLLAVALVVLAVGLGPDFGWATASVIGPGVALVVLLLAALVVASFSSKRVDAWISQKQARLSSRRWVGSGGTYSAILAVSNSIRGAVARLDKLRQGGGVGLSLLLVSHLVYIANFVAIAVVLGDGLGVESDLLCAGAATVFIAFSYVAPTPGGSGLSEAMAVPFFGALAGPERAVVLVLLLRAATFYFQVLFGLGYLLIIGGAKEIIRTRKPHAQ